MTTLATRPACATSTPSSTAATPAPTARYDIYVGIHKGLRLFMQDTVRRVGRIDLDDAQDLDSTLAQVQSLLEFMHGHVEHENDYVHAAIEARLPAAAARTIADHREHLEELAELQGEVLSLRRAPVAQRPLLALRLYRHLNLFVAENLQHMNVEETVNNAALWAAYSDAEIHEIHGRLQQSLSPQVFAESVRWIVPAVTPQELAGMLGEMQRGMPPESFRAVLDMVRPHLDTARWDRLARALGVPQVPGLVMMAG